MINIERDSDGNTFQLWKQDQLNSCGVASIWMARGIARQQSFAEDEFDLAWRVYNVGVRQTLAALGTPPSGAMSFAPTADRTQNTFASTFSNFGLYATQVAAAIRAEGLNVHHVNATTACAIVVPHLIGDRRTAIVLVKWDGGGGHFVVAARAASSGNIVFLDPWDGHINEQPNNQRYVARYGGAGRIIEYLYLSA